jgi:hypothetical protein
MKRMVFQGESTTTSNKRPVHLSLLAKSANHLTVFFSHNKSANCTFYHGFSASEQGESTMIISITL